MPWPFVPDLAHRAPGTYVVSGAWELKFQIPTGDGLTIQVKIRKSIKFFLFFQGQEFFQKFLSEINADCEKTEPIQRLSFLQMRFDGK